MILGLGGSIGAGKTYASQYLSGKGWTDLSVSDPLKKICIDLGFEYKNIYGSQVEKSKVGIWGISGREAMQKIGTELFRDTLPKILPTMKNVWIRCLLIKIHKIREIHPYANIVIDGIRFKDEAAAVKKLGGILIRIVNPLIYPSTPREIRHQSELMYDIKWDHVIKNKKGTDTLKNTINIITGNRYTYWDQWKRKLKKMILVALIIICFIYKKMRR